MICTNVIPCLSSGLSKNNKVIVLYSWLFWPFESLAFSKMGDKQDIFSQFFKNTTMKLTIFQK